MRKNFQRNKSLTETVEQQILSKIELIDTEFCIIWPGALAANGYGVICSGKYLNSGKPGIEYVHRLLWEYVNKAKLGEAHICHSCDTPACVNPLHLIKGDQSRNTRDMQEKGRHVRRSDDFVREIRARLAAGERQKTIAREMGCTQGFVSGVNTGYFRKNVV